MLAFVKSAENRVPWRLIEAIVAALPPLPAGVVRGAILKFVCGNSGPPTTLKTVSEFLSESGSVTLDGDTDCAEARVEIPRRKRAKVKKLAALLATVDVAMMKQKKEEREE